MKRNRSKEYFSNLYKYKIDHVISRRSKVIESSNRRECQQSCLDNANNIGFHIVDLHGTHCRVTFYICYSAYLFPVHFLANIYPYCYFIQFSTYRSPKLPTFSVKLFQIASIPRFPSPRIFKVLKSQMGCFTFFFRLEIITNVQIIAVFLQKQPFGYIYNQVFHIHRVFLLPIVDDVEWMV